MSLFRVAVLGSLFVAVASSQSNRHVPERGARPGMPFTLSDADVIDNVTGNVNLRIPLADLPAGRAGNTLPAGIRYHSAQFDIDANTNLPGTQVALHKLEGKTDGSVWTYEYKYGFTVEYRGVGANCNIPEEMYFQRMWVLLPDGSRRLLRLHSRTNYDMADYGGDGYNRYSYTGNALCPQQNVANPYPGVMAYFTIDGSNVRFEINAAQPCDGTGTFNWWIFMPDGTRAAGCLFSSSAPIFEARAIFDRNNNKIAVETTFVQGGGTTTVITADGRQPGLGLDSVAIFTGLSSGTRDVVQYTSADGATRQVTVTWGTKVLGGPLALGGLSYICTVQNDSCRICPVGDTNCVAPQQHFLGLAQVTSIEIPLPSATTPTRFEFKYDEDCPSNTRCWGEMRSAEMKIGTASQYKVNYTYSRDNQSRLLDDVDNPVKTKQFCYNGDCTAAAATPVENWTFDFTSPTKSVIEDPSDATTEHYFYDRRNLSDSRHGLVHKVKFPNGSTLDRTWKQNITVNHPISSVTSNPYARFEIRNVASGGVVTKCAVTERTVDQNGNTVKLRESDWLSASGGTCDTYSNGAGVTYVRTTTNTYHAATPDAVEAGVTDVATNEPCWRPRDTVPWSPLASVRHFRALKRATVSDAGGTAAAITENEYDAALTKANRTKEWRWDSTKQAAPPTTALGAGNSILNQWAYTAYGDVASHTSPNGNITEITYDTAFLNPTKTTVGGIREFTYGYPAKGWPLETLTDDNGLKSTYVYDGFGRVT